MNRFTQLSAALSVGVLAASSASAASVDLQGFTGDWMNAVGGSSVNYSSDPGNNPQVRWGTDLGDDQSGYGLNLADGTVNHMVPPNTGAFAIGTFTHYNNPIGAGTSISQIDLRITFEILIDAVSQGVRSFDFRFSHDETDNGANPCKYAGPNQNGCADRVLVTPLDITDTFMVGNTEYTFDLLGFSTNGGDTITTDFLTKEKWTNEAQLYAQIRSYTRDVPEPGTLVLLGAGLLGLGVARRRPVSA